MSRALRTRTRVLSTLLLTCTAMTWFSTPLFANPEGGLVVGGGATISAADKIMTVEQATDRAAINWSSFNINTDETLRFIQPTASSIMLNRVTGSDPSKILGRIDANGKIILLNRSGILFGKDLRIDVGSLVASTADIDTNAFMTGGGLLDLSIPGEPSARIVNQGHISAKEAGLVGLVAPQVENSGIITARLGRIQIGAGETATLDLYGDNLMSFAVTNSDLQQAINHTGLLQADGGTIQLSAAAGRSMVNSLIGVSGTVAARAVGSRRGRIIMYAPGSNAVAHNSAADKNLKQGFSSVVADGLLDVSGYEAGEQGGSIEMLGDRVMLAEGTVFDASGDLGGGDIKIGGDYLGTGETPASAYTYVDQKSLILNNAITAGHGGRTIIWSDGDTRFLGNVFARGGANGGNGGFVETSGHNHLDALGFVDLSAPSGEKGTYLLDPANIAVYGNVTPRFNATDSAVNLLGSLRLWADGSDPSTITLTYSSDALSSARITGVAGATTISTTTNLNLTAPLVAGAKIRLGSVDGQTALANDATNTNTYTIQSVSYTAGVGTTITLTTPLSANYNTGAGNNFVYRGLVSQWVDKSNNSYAITGGAIVRMPLWVSNAQNGLGGLRFDGADNMISPTGAYPINADYTVGVLVNQTAVNTGNVLSGIGSGHAFYFNGGQRICMFAGGCFATSSTNLAYGTAGILNGTFNNATRVGNIYQNSLSVGSGTAAASNTQNTFNLGSYGNANYYTGFIDEALLFNSVLSTNARNLLEQYQSAKWGVALDPFSGTALAEATEAMDATNGFSVFAAEYLERLSASANIALQASNNITLDLQTDTLNLAAAGRNITLTAGNQINTLSAGNITTNGGNITFNATGGINFAHAIGLTSNGGNITMSNNVTTAAALNIAAGTGNVTFTGKVNGSGSVTASGNAMTVSDVWGDITPLNAVSMTSASGVTLPSITASSILVRANGAGSDVRIGAGSTLSASGAGNSLVLSAGRNFVNNSGAAAISTPSGRWLVYSTRPADNIRNGLLPSATAIYNATYATVAPGTVAAGNRLLFSDPAAAAPALTFTADAQSKQYGTANPSLTYTRTGSFVDADTAVTAFSGTPSVTTVIDGTTGAGTYTGGITTTVGSLSTYLGYQFSFVNGNFTITPAPLTITATNATKNYGAVQVFAGTEFLTSGLLNSDAVSSVTLTSAGAAATASVAGSPYTITPSAATGTGLANYTITYANGQLTLNAVPLTILANNRVKTYGVAVTFAGTEFSSSGLLNSDTITSVTLSSAGSAATASVAGSPYTITPSAAIGTGLGNYTITYSDGQMTVDPAPLTITADDQTRLYGQSDPPFTATFSGLVAGDVPADIGGLTLTTPATMLSPPGTYAIVASGAISANYVITLANGLLTIGGSIPLPFGGVSGQSLPEVLSRMIEAINDPVPRYSAGWSNAAFIEFDKSLQYFLSCTQKRPEKKELGTSCW